MAGSVRLLFAVGLALAAAASPAGARVNRNPNFIQVYDDNVENLETAAERPCPGDWQDLVYAMKAHPLAPDLFIVQQVTGRAQLNGLIGVMNRRLPGRYAGVIAQANPKPFNSPSCRARSARGGRSSAETASAWSTLSRGRSAWRSG